MFAKVSSLGLFGLNAFPVDVEINLSKGLPRFEIVGLADAAVVGSIYTAPSARAIQTVTRSVPNKDGIVYICTNHAGDVLNFELAGELAELEGIETRTIAAPSQAGVYVVVFDNKKSSRILVR